MTCLRFLPGSHHGWDSFQEKASEFFLHLTFLNLLPVKDIKNHIFFIYAPVTRVTWAPEAHTTNNTSTTIALLGGRVGVPFERLRWSIISDAAGLGMFFWWEKPRIGRRFLFPIFQNWKISWWFFWQKICWNQEKTVRNKPPFQIEVPGEKLIDSVYLEMICLPVMPVKSECSVRKPLQKIRWNHPGDPCYTVAGEYITSQIFHPFVCQHSFWFGISIWSHWNEDWTRKNKGILPKTTSNSCLHSWESKHTPQKTIRPY